MSTSAGAAKAIARPEVFTRKASGLVRVMSPWSAMFYNILAMGVIFPWTYLWAPGSLPGGHLVWGIILAMLFELPIALVYVFLSTALPRSGGDYVFQSRVWGGGTAFAITMSGIVIWQLVWIALAGWLLSYLGFAPLFLGLGATLGNPALASLGVAFTTAPVITVVSVLNAAGAFALLVSGFKNYVSVQRWMVVFTAIAIATTIIVLFVVDPKTVPDKLNAFAVAVGGAPGYYQGAIDAVKAKGIDMNPAFSLLATLLVASIAWTSLQWATYSAEQNGEIKDAKSFKTQALIFVGGLLITGFLLAVLGYAFERSLGTQFLYVAGAGYWNGVGQAYIAGFNLWPPILAVALTGSPIIVVMIGLGYIFNSFQIANNIMIGTTRIMVAASLDRAMTEWFSRVHDRLHTPVNAHLAFLLASIPAILCYNLVPGWIALTLGVTFGGGLGFTGSALAGIFFPYKAKEVYAASPGAKYTVNSYIGMLFGVAGVFAWIWASWVMAPLAFPSSLFLITLVRTACIVGVFAFLWPLREQLPGWFRGEKMPWPTALGMLGGGFGMAMVLSFLLSPALGVLGNWDFTDFPTHLWSQILAFGIILFCIVWYAWTKRSQKAKGINIDFAFKEIPPE
jgi:APA family basic amino acid/polyamine antiporter